MAKPPVKDDKEWTISKEALDRLVREHKGTVSDVLITPTMASYILKHYNTDNRRLRINHANAFSATLKRGAFENTGEPIIFAKEGMLNNGQHRLEGIVRSKVAAKIDMRFGIPRTAFAVTDTGARRLAGDVLSTFGSASPFASAASIKLLLAYEQGLPTAYYSRFGNDEILEGFRRWEDMELAVALTSKALKHRAGFINASSNVFAFLAMRQTNEEAVKEFLSLVESGLTKAAHDAPRLLRERLLTETRLQTGTRAVTLERLALFIKAWNFWRAGERPKKLTWLSSETFPNIPNIDL